MKDLEFILINEMGKVLAKKGFVMASEGKVHEGQGIGFSLGYHTYECPTKSIDFFAHVVSRTEDKSVVKVTYQMDVYGLTFDIPGEGIETVRSFAHKKNVDVVVDHLHCATPPTTSFTFYFYDVFDELDIDTLKKSANQITPLYECALHALELDTRNE